ncbi:MAG: hypothetical protein A3C93_02100 [Candidatus Lloydbacteria bacterium RIFCSPHIGHO2_02_FULL_54_17]|uniref:Glycosyl transferase family 1 domain-containing protein n=1 Tax=Candidatus Lloydbacteria bacterium RIFCSPHIGHO2_02_FULL_54_17 TaxID=1798664 RepID=A0A1G2DHU3_9BACT|nr:MAG: hypothetical protein A3C93_02100 [Candidatus Lloydbacteria bacterium RIFCSPHIGHO2_02_FULL_54_17]OGZ15374.1 MAG: hypothetical protein A2948_00115 [Candidatus Lloydbacteria bacterium RIFCSPLOWO2_01_FULL_54_18]OGZ15805.1 MAG: hypothetical protein A3H76_05785 [Candidatus Lloydbacteria bacterium RIFCSPLOWO2_02_FULL_54_12]
MELIVPSIPIEQPPVHAVKDNELTVAIASLSIGGAERIVLDWAARIYPKWRVHLVVVKDRDTEWPVPDFVRVTRLANTRILEQLEELGQEIAAKPIPVVTCHLFKKAWRDALIRGGARVVTVLHNAKNGWEEGVASLEGSMNVIAVSGACKNDLNQAGWQGPVSVIRHIPPRWKFAADARERYRREWNIPADALVIGMVGAVKPQKNYCRALAILKMFLEKRDAYLVIVGGPVNMAVGREEWTRVVDEVYRLDIRHRVAMPGFIAGATACTPAFDVMLNTSNFEGLSIATLEVLVNGMPMVASKVGGQGEIGCEGLILLPAEAGEDEWVDALLSALNKKFTEPSWAKFPSHRLWSLAGIARPVPKTGKVLFVGANLNSGGAQRSLVNLAKRLHGKMPLEVAITTRSTTEHFTRELRNAGITVELSSGQWDPFFHAEALTEKVCAEGFDTVCFWNLDARVKLLLVKALGFTDVRFIDVSPGGYAFLEMDAVKEFAELIAFSIDDYHRRLDKMVLKWGGTSPKGCTEKTVVIKNGVPKPHRIKTDYTIRDAPRVVVSGRIAPSKFVVEIIRAMRLVREKIPDAQLHIFGAAEPEHAAYAEEVSRETRDELDTQTFFHGSCFDVAEKLSGFDAYVVLGLHQGCPNALLEALAVGMPSVANDDGGTREQVENGVTGLLVPDCDPKHLVEALIRILSDRVLAKKLGEAGRAHIEETFSMKRMVRAYEALFREEVAMTPEHDKDRQTTFVDCSAEGLAQSMA